MPANRGGAMLTRSALTAIAAVLVLSGSPAAMATKGKPRAAVKPLAREGTGTARTGTTRARVKPLHATMGRTPRGSTVAARNAAVEQVEEVEPVGRTSRRAARAFHPTPKPSIGKNLGWGTFFGTLAAASLVTGGT